MESNDATARLAYQTRRLRDLIDEKDDLWADQGGRTTLHEYLHPQAEAAEDLVRALRGHDELLAAFENEMAVVERELEAAAVAHGRAEAALAQAMEDVRVADETLPEVLQNVAAAAKLGARAVRLADLANEYPGNREAEAARRRRRAELSRLQKSYPTLGVRHILEGEFNGKGKFTGCHSRRSVIGEILTSEGPDARGVYYAAVAGWSPDEKIVDKTVPVHTMFPDDWTDDQICGEVLDAYREALDAGDPPDQWRGVSSKGVAIMGRTKDDGSIIAFPIRRIL